MDVRDSVAPMMWIQILTVVACLPLPGFILASLMRADSPNYEANWTAVMAVFCVSFYPFALASLYFFKHWTLFGVPAIILVVVTALAGIGAFVISGAAGEASDLVRGIKWTDLSISQQQVYFARKPIPEADAATAVSLGSGYWKDKNSAYFETERISGVDLKTAHVVGRYLIDDKSVFNGVKKTSLRPDGFEDLGDTYLKDRERVFFGDQLINGADAASFRVVRKQLERDGSTESRAWAVDKDHVFSVNDGKIIEGADPKTFELQFGDNPSIGRDSKHVFFSSLVINGADPSSFKTLRSNYAKDVRSVYYLHWVDKTPTVQTVEGADSGSFETVDFDPNKESKDQADARDSSHRFKSGKMLGPN